MDHNCLNLTLWVCPLGLLLWVCSLFKPDPLGLLLWVSPFGGGQISFRDLPSDASFLGIAHSHSLGNYDTYLSRVNFWRPDVTPQSQQEWAIARERFSGDPGDLGVAARNGHEYSLHTPSGNLRYVTPESALAGLASGNLNGQAMPGAPSAGDAAKIVTCIKAGK